MNPRYVAIALVAILLAAGGAYWYVSHEASDAIRTGTLEEPLDSLEIGADDAAMRTFYVKAGGTVSVKNYSDDDVSASVEHSSAAGIVLTDKGAFGTAPEGLVLLDLLRTVGEDADTPVCVIIGVPEASR